MEGTEHIKQGQRLRGSHFEKENERISENLEKVSN